jgi:hypothetical protein
MLAQSSWSEFSTVICLNLIEFRQVIVKILLMGSTWLNTWLDNLIFIWSYGSYKWSLIITYLNSFKFEQIIIEDHNLNLLLNWVVSKVGRRANKRAHVMGCSLLLIKFWEMLRVQKLLQTGMELHERLHVSLILK